MADAVLLRGVLMPQSGTTASRWCSRYAPVGHDVQASRHVPREPSLTARCPGGLLALVCGRGGGPALVGCGGTLCVAPYVRHVPCGRRRSRICWGAGHQPAASVQAALSVACLPRCGVRMAHSRVTLESRCLPLTRCDI
eukprot:6144055-Prymnesium_polylepis.1